MIPPLGTPEGLAISIHTRRLRFKKAPSIILPEFAVARYTEQYMTINQ